MLYTFTLGKSDNKSQENLLRYFGKRKKKITEVENLGLFSDGSQNEHTQIIPDMRSHTYYDRKMPLLNGRMSIATIRPKTQNKRVCSDNFDFIWCKNLNDDLAAIYKIP